MEEATRLLVVDDDPFVRRAIARTLGNAYAMQDVGDLDAAVVCATATRFDVVVVDYLLPGITGLDIIARLREILPDAAFVLASGNLDLPVLIEAFNAGQVSYLLSKPWQDDVLKRVLAQAAQRAKSGSVVRPQSDLPPSPRTISAPSAVASSAPRARVPTLADASVEAAPPSPGDLPRWALPTFLVTTVCVALGCAFGYRWFANAEEAKAGEAALEVARSVAEVAQQTPSAASAFEDLAGLAYAVVVDASGAVVGGFFDPSVVQEQEPYEQAAVLARLVMLRDGEGLRVAQASSGQGSELRTVYVGFERSSVRKAQQSLAVVFVAFGAIMAALAAVVCFRRRGA